MFNEICKFVSNVRLDTINKKAEQQHNIVNNFLVEINRI